MDIDVAIKSYSPIRVTKIYNKYTATDVNNNNINSNKFY